jgi:hypothetical protein
MRDILSGIAHRKCLKIYIIPPAETEYPEEKLYKPVHPVLINRLLTSSILSNQFTASLNHADHWSRYASLDRGLIGWNRNLLNRAAQGPWRPLLSRHCMATHRVISSTILSHKGLIVNFSAIFQEVKKRYCLVAATWYNGCDLRTTRERFLSIPFVNHLQRLDIQCSWWHCWDRKQPDESCNCKLLLLRYSRLGLITLVLTSILCLISPVGEFCFPNQYIHCGILDSSDWLLSVIYKRARLFTMCYMIRRVIMA